ncbi:MAG: TM2 domain-containing membrane protein YozV [Lentimonas sp.]|jgi:TM2 domain-containing membrane protein YozV
MNFNRPLSPSLKPLIASLKTHTFTFDSTTQTHSYMPEQGSTGNVIAALCSFFIPGLGQLVQGRLLIAIIQFVLAAVLWIVLLGWIIHLWSILDAALFKGK